MGKLLIFPEANANRKVVGLDKAFDIGNVFGKGLPVGVLPEKLGMRWYNFRPDPILFTEIPIDLSTKLAPSSASVTAPDPVDQFKQTGRPPA